MIVPGVSPLVCASLRGQSDAPVTVKAVNTLNSIGFEILTALIISPTQRRAVSPAPHDSHLDALPRTLPAPSSQVTALILSIQGLLSSLRYSSDLVFP